MFPYIFAIWLLSCYSSSGAPTSKSTAVTIPNSGGGVVALNETDLPTSLNILANSCGNQILAPIIKSRLNDCATVAATNAEKHFQCMLFYDINRQLCTTLALSKVPGDNIAIIQAPLNIEDVCKSAEKWTFTDLGEVYKKTVKLVFEDPVRCTKICIEETTDILSVESNFYCKYFKWGSDMLKSVSLPETGVEDQPKVVASKPVEMPAVDQKNVLAVDPPPSSSVKAPQVTSNIHAAENPNTHVSKAVPQETAPVNVKNVPDKGTLTNIPNKENHEETSVVEHPLLDSDPAIEPSIENDDQIEDKAAQDIIVTAAKDQNTDVQLGAEKDEVKSNPAKMTVDEKKVPLNNEPNKVVQPQKQNDIGDSDDYQGDLDSDEGRGLPDTQGGDDGDDPIPLDTEMKPDLDLNKKRTEIQQGIDISQKDYYSNTITDGFPEEDDHFFPFFLTAIIMVVLMYVLYHNKSKVSKVVMGLIVEGRQPGRRRNSRGHAYKRLDTLEQAMSANTAAPPSKIIY